MKVTRSKCCDAPVLSVVEPVSKNSVMMVNKCTACGQRCETVEKEKSGIEESDVGRYPYFIEHEDGKD